LLLNIVLTFNPQDVENQTILKMKKYKIVYYTLVLLTLSISNVNNSIAQQTQPIINATLSGTVIDAVTKEPLVGVTVRLDAVTHQVTTDNKGLLNFDEYCRYYWLCICC